jgi:hypothetical protein
MRCVECDCERDPSERGWVTVLSPSGSLRIHYCPECMSDLVTRSADDAEVDDYANDD